MTAAAASATGIEGRRKEGSPAAADAAESCYYKTCTDIDISGGGLRLPHTEFHLKARNGSLLFVSVALRACACLTLVSPFGNSFRN